MLLKILSSKAVESAPLLRGGFRCRSLNRSYTLAFKASKFVIDAG